jgi:hypothetical protein
MRVDLAAGAMGKRIEARLEELGWKRRNLLALIPELTQQIANANLAKDIG